MSINYAALFLNIHRVMEAEDVLTRAELFCDLTPVPREISSECGLALVFAEKDRPGVEKCLSDAGIDILALFEMNESGSFQPVFDRR